MRRQSDPESQRSFAESQRPFAFDVLNVSILLAIVWGAFSLSFASTNSTADFEFSDPVLAGGNEELMLAYRPDLSADLNLPAAGSLD